MELLPQIQYVKSSNYSIHHTNIHTHIKVYKMERFTLTNDVYIFYFLKCRKIQKAKIIMKVEIEPKKIITQRNYAMADLV